MAARIYRITIHVGDLARASADYATLLGAEARPVGGGRVYLDCGPVILALLAPGPTPAPLPDHLYLAVGADELDEAHSRATGLGWLSAEPVHGEPGEKIVVRPWRERSFYVQDPWGNRLCFVDDTTLFTGTERRG